jgi:hypothetical protein
MPSPAVVGAMAIHVAQHGEMALVSGRSFAAKCTAIMHRPEASALAEIEVWMDGESC